MGFLQNTWLRYWDRSYQQVKDSTLTRLQSRVPEMTDHTESNIFVKMISIWAGIAEMLGYYSDNAAREAFIDSVRRYASAVKHCKKFDYRIKSSTAATVAVTFVLNAVSDEDVVIPSGTRVDDSVLSLKFFTTASLTIPAGDPEGTVNAVQAESLTDQSLGNADGSEDLVIVLPANLQENTLAVRVDGENWTPQETLAYSTPLAKDYIVTVNEQGIPILKFGDTLNGAIPGAGLPIEADYKTTSGATGNVEAGSIDTIVTALTLPAGVQLTVTNRDRASGGASVETLDSIKKRLPLFNRTLLRAVTKQDYIDIAELQPNVALAGVDFNCGKTVNVYVVPEGGGIATSDLLDDVVDWFEDKRMITTRVKALAAGEVHVLITLNIKVLPQYQTSVVVAAVKARLVDFLSYLHQKINGYVQISDIYQIVEDTDGVDYSDLISMTPVPYARPLINDANPDIPALSWARQVLQTSTITRKWTITMLNSSTYQLLRDNSFIGTFDVGTEYTFPEIKLTINDAGYEANDRWEFYTYPFFGTLYLIEQSLPVAIDSDITINPDGGL